MSYSWLTGVQFIWAARCTSECRSVSRYHNFFIRGPEFLQYYNSHKLLMVRKNTDLRKVVGSTIKVLVIHVIAKQECQGRFGSQKKAKRPKGTVIRAYSVKKARAKWATTWIETDLIPKSQIRRRERGLWPYRCWKLLPYSLPAPFNPPPRSPPRSSLPRPPSIQNTLNKCSFWNCNGLLPLTLMNEYQDPGFSKRLHHTC